MTGPRPSDRLLVAAAALAAATTLVAADAAGRRAGMARDLAVRAAIVKRLGLSDLCLFTEASYTRHPALADRFAAFQDAPGAREKFPSGGLLAPPVHPAARAGGTEPPGSPAP